MAAGFPRCWIAVAAGILYTAASAVMKRREIPGSAWLLILEGAVSTFLRVTLSLLLAAAWTIPAGGCDWVQSAAGADCAADVVPGGGFVSGSDPAS